jgi:hypothetical protein
MQSIILEVQVEARNHGRMNLRDLSSAPTLAALFLFSALGVLAQPAQPIDPLSVVHGIDASVQARIDHVAGYTVTEHYAVFRDGDETHPAAEMTVKTDYRKEQGKSYTILSQSGSGLLRSELLGKVLDREKEMSQPGMRETVLVNSANYEMRLKSASSEMVDGHECLVLSLTPKRNSPSLFKGTLWVDAADYSIVQLEGTAAKSASFLTGAAQVMRQYAKFDGFPMATHASAVSKSSLLGKTVVKIDYSAYQIQLRAGQ